jgi:hypothetical protein
MAVPEETKDQGRLRRRKEDPEETLDGRVVSASEGYAASQRL